ncbi:zinc-finger-containing protein [Serratia marcescens]|uniref:zinc-finger-containing protein n=1 Tax=Serratia TaxID=613 RepID=UPI00093066A5|nr:zinc-finger-containing protein [Serratia marcescens]MDX6800645.1 zinc-finger-containing protein [Serratia marcescens]MDX6905104.1 zinc-finger-containing protein [Serratia marcescens]HEJ9051035.1 hypothetical protein [Serratia marcescens]
MEIKTPDNPGRSATARVKNPLPAPTICRFCSGSVRVAGHAEIYGGREFSDWPYVYLCDSCAAYVGLHPFTAIPLGTLADEPTRKARKECKPYFERLFNRKLKVSGLTVPQRFETMDRNGAYSWLADQMQIPVAECHFGWFNIEQCQKAKAICISFFSTLTHK